MLKVKIICFFKQNLPISTNVHIRSKVSASIHWCILCQRSISNDSQKGMVTRATIKSLMAKFMRKWFVTCFRTRLKTRNITIIATLPLIVKSMTKHKAITDPMAPSSEWGLITWVGAVVADWFAGNDVMVKKKNLKNKFEVLYYQFCRGFWNFWMTYERNSGNTKAAFFPVRLSLVNLRMRYPAIRGNLFPMTYETDR